ncbi:TPA: phosphate uptake regulator PhoU [Candidatus Woesearchaeota archaeon]|nr:phosphate uptake regulator PhoU [Candidatus Woesearchaeota archaeon]
MQIRRLVKSGAASHTISLPKSWLDKNNLKKGDIIYLLEKSDKELVVTPETKPEVKQEKEISINIEKKDLTTIQREITSAYINNYNTIVIHGDGLADQVKDIRKILHDFVALEISELTSTRIVAKDLLNLQEISVDKTVRRMDMIIRSIVQDSIESIDGKNMYESVYYRDFDVNKLYFLMCRILKSSLNDSRVAEKFQITNTQGMASWFLSLNLENIADNSKNICLHLKNLGKDVNTKELKEIYKEVEKTYLDAMKAHYNSDRKLADTVAAAREQLFNKCDGFFEKHNSVDVFKVISNIKEMENQICNIARIVIDREEVKKDEK